MKKFLSILLAVMMVLSTVSFAAPSLAGTADTAVELPVVEEVVENTEDAELMVEHKGNHEFSLEFDSADDLKKITLRNGTNKDGLTNNSLGNDFVKIEDGCLVATFEAIDPTMVVQDTGMMIPTATAAAGAVTALEMKVMFTGMPEEAIKLNQFGGGSHNYNPVDVHFPQLYITTNGAMDASKGESYRTAITNGEWITLRYTAEDLGLNDLGAFRFDFFDYMPDGSKMYVDYIRFEGNDYETLAKYDVEFDSESDLTSKVRVQTNNGVNTVTWNEEGYMTIKSVPIEGYTATWDQQVYVDTVSPATALPAGVVDEIVVRMRFRNLPTENKTYTIQNRDDTSLNVANMPGYVHIAKYGTTVWGQNLQSNDMRYKNVVDGQWFERRMDAETYFAEGMAYVRLDTPYPLPAGVEIDYDYIRFVGDNSKVPASEWEGEYGELVLEVNFEDLAVGKAGTAFSYDMQSGGATAGNFIANYGSKVNPGFDCSKANIYFRNESGLADIEIKEDADHGKYVSYTITSSGASKNVWDLNSYNSQYSFSQKDGYFILTYDLLSPKDGMVVQSHWNRSHTAEDVLRAAGKYNNAVANEWTQMVEIYDASTIGTSSHKPPIADITELNHILLYNNGQQVGETYAFDNIRLWWVPKTVKVQVVGDGIFLENEVSPTMKVSEFLATIPEFGTSKVTGLSLDKDGEELLDADSVLGLTYATTLYAVVEKIETLEGSNEFNTEEDLAKVYASWAQARLGTNNAKTTAKEQFVLGSDDSASYLVMENEAASGEGGCVVDYGFIVTTTPFSKETVSAIEIKLRVKGLPETATAYDCGGIHGNPPCTARSHSVNPTDCNYMELVWWDADSSSLKQDYRRMNLKGNEDWVVVTIPAEEFWFDNVKQLRFDPFGDYAPHGASVELDYIRFLPYPPEELDVLGYSAEFNESESGIGLVSWKKEDGTYMVDDGVNGDFGVGTGSAFIGNADDYITWNEEGYVTLNFVANEEVKVAAAAKGATAFVYDASAYVGALDNAKYIPAGAFDEIKIRMRFRDLPADGTALYGLAYANWKDHTWNLNAAENYFYFHYSNVKGGVLYDGAKATAKNFNGFEFSKGSYKADAWFEITIPASYFEADVNPLETLRLNIPDYMPDGAKIDIDYIRFLGTAPDAEAPVTNETTELRYADETYSNAIRFKASVAATTADVSTDIGWLVSTANYLEANGINYGDLSFDHVTSDAKIKVAYQRLEGENKANFFDTRDDEFPVFAAFLHNIPSQNALDTIVIKSFVNVNGTYLYSNHVETSLYDVAIAPYINFISEDFADFEELYESDYTFDYAIDMDFEYNDDYYELDEDQQVYIEETLIALLG